jgi:glycosyltransferase involved in cell wall biosynthesis
MPNSQKRIVIFTTFSEYSKAYSLNVVVQDQLKMLLNAGYSPCVIVNEGFEPQGIYADERVTIKKIPNVAVFNEVKKDENFDGDVKALENALDSIIKDVDIVLTHDVVYQNACLKHNLAARKVATKYPNVKWLHWIHSATSPQILSALRPIFGDEYQEIVKTPFPNSYYVFFNHYSIPRIAENFGVPEESVRVVHHPSDLKEVYGLSEKVDKFVRDKKIYSVDAVCVYPIRLDRGKQVEVVIKTMAMLKEFGMSVRVIIVDFHSTGGDKVDYRDELKTMAIDWGLNSDEIIWTSETYDDWAAEVDHSDVMSLMRMSNVFIMPSVSESYSLITQEAGMNKVVAVLNFDFPPFRDIFGQNAIYRKYSSNIDVMNGMDGNTTTEYGPTKASPEERKMHEKIYHKETAGMIAAKLRSYKDLALSIFLRKYRNLDYVFKQELEPLFFEEKA